MKTRNRQLVFTKRELQEMGATIRGVEEPERKKKKKRGWMSVPEDGTNEEEEATIFSGEGSEAFREMSEVLEASVNKAFDALPDYTPNLPMMSGGTLQALDNVIAGLSDDEYAVSNENESAEDDFIIPITLATKDDSGSDESTQTFPPPVPAHSKSNGDVDKETAFRGDGHSSTTNVSGVVEKDEALLEKDETVKKSTGGLEENTAIVEKTDETEKNKAEATGSFDSVFKAFSSSGDVTATSGEIASHKEQAEGLLAGGSSSGQSPVEASFQDDEEEEDKDGIVKGTNIKGSDTVRIYSGALVNDAPAPALEDESAELLEPPPVPEEEKPPPPPVPEEEKQSPPPPVPEEEETSPPPPVPEEEETSPPPVPEEEKQSPPPVPEDDKRTTKSFPPPVPQGKPAGQEPLSAVEVVESEEGGGASAKGLKGEDSLNESSREKAYEKPSAPKKKKKAKRKAKKKTWFEGFFNDDYLLTLPYETTDVSIIEADFIQKQLDLPKESRLLDLGCGYGRHAVEMARKGYNLVGLDSSLPMLIKAAELGEQYGVEVNFMHGDMKDMSFENKFDGVYCFNTSFGYFDDDLNKKVLGQIFNALNPGGRFLLEVVNRDFILTDLPLRVWWEGNGCVVMEEVEFNYFTSRIESNRSVVFNDGRQVDHNLSIRVYSLHELGRLLHQSGFVVRSVTGNLATPGRFFGPHSPYLIIKSERKK